MTVAAGQEHSHTPEAVALLAALNAEAAENAEARGDPPLADGQDDWSAAERVVLEMIACAVDRKVDLSARYSAADDEKLRIKLSGEDSVPRFGGLRISAGFRVVINESC